MVTLGMMGRMVVVGIETGMQMDQDFRVCRWAKLSHLQHEEMYGV